MRAPAPASNVSVSFLMSISSERKSRTRSNASIETPFQISTLTFAFDETVDRNLRRCVSERHRRSRNQWNPTHYAKRGTILWASCFFMRWADFDPRTKFGFRLMKGANMRVADVMTRSVFIVNPDETIQEAATAMAGIDAGILPVANDDRLVGMITDRDIAVRGVAEGKGPDTKVFDVMTEDIRYCFDD